MTHSRLLQLMHAALDGEATPEEARELDERLAGDAAAQAQFAELRGLFDGFARGPQRFPPEGLVAAVTANLPAIESSRADTDQLFASSGVIDANTGNVRGSSPGKRAGVDRVFPLWAFLRGDTMNEKTSGSGKRKILIGSGIAVAAGAVGISTGLFPPGSDTAGTIVPAERYRAQQPGDLQGTAASGNSTTAQNPAQASQGTAGTLGTSGTSGTLGT